MPYWEDPEVLAYWREADIHRTGFWEDVSPVFSWPRTPINEAVGRFADVAGTPLGRFRDRFGNWFVTDDGLECIAPPYVIGRDRIGEPDWFRHLCTKHWTQPHHVACALMAARELHTCESQV